jgi:hypothetical protein
MSFAWQVSDEDVRNVLKEESLPADDATVTRVLVKIDEDQVEAVALNGDTLEDQTELAKTELRRQIMEMETI